MYILYDCVFCLYALLYIPCLLIRQKWHEDFTTRFGIFSPAIRQRLTGKKTIWIHAVSVGEVVVALRVIDALNKRFPSYHIVLSTVTATGHSLAEKRLGDSHTLIYAPLDFSSIVKRFIALIRPSLYVTIETELWPNILYFLHRAHIPVAVVNGRISNRSFRGYRMVRGVLKHIMRTIDVFCMQSSTDVQRIRALGADERNVHPVGNIKFDQLPIDEENDTVACLFSDDETVFIAGSTHLGEEDIILKMFSDIIERHPMTRLVIAPRHTERTEDVVQYVSRYGFDAVKFSEINTAQRTSTSVIIVDTIGQLCSLYRRADIVFVGKSLTVGGGHNIIEPAYYGKPIIIGPRVGNFKDIVDIFLGEGALIQISDANELLSAVHSLLDDPDCLREIGARAQEVVKNNTGAVNRTIEILASRIDSE